MHVKKQNEWSRHNNFPVVFYIKITHLWSIGIHTPCYCFQHSEKYLRWIWCCFFIIISHWLTHIHTEFNTFFFSCQHAKMLFETKKKRCGTQPISSLLIEFHLMTTRIARLKNAQKNMQIIWIDNEIAANRIECENPSKRVKIFHHNVSLECLFCIFLYRLDSIVNSWKKK